MKKSYQIPTIEVVELQSACMLQIVNVSGNGGVNNGGGSSNNSGGPFGRSRERCEWEEEDWSFEDF